MDGLSPALRPAVLRNHSRGALRDFSQGHGSHRRRRVRCACRMRCIGAPSARIDTQENDARIGALRRIAPAVACRPARAVRGRILKKAAREDSVMLRIAVAAGLIGLALPAGAAERVQFESARYQLGPLQLRLARERGETVARPPAEIISGYLTKPNGAGPFPAVVHLHGCNGLSKAFKSGTDMGQWSEQLA